MSSFAEGLLFILPLRLNPPQVARVAVRVADFLVASSRKWCPFSVYVSKNLTSCHWSHWRQK